MASPSNDKTGMTCDAVSVAFGFTADPANMGTVVSAGVKSTLCDGGVEADDCTSP
jgi:hypothetical protein